MSNRYASTRPKGKDPAEVQLTMRRPQLAVLTMGVLLALGMMFAVGYLVGQRAATLSAPAVPQATAEVVRQEAPLSFHSQLREPKPQPVDVDAAVERVARHVAVLAKEERDEFDPKASVETTTALSSSGGGGGGGHEVFTVQVSAFQTNAEARAYLASLERLGLSPHVVSAEVPGKGRWYRVRVGNYETKEAAERAKSSLAQQAIPGWVLRVE